MNKSINFTFFILVAATFTTSCSSLNKKDKWKHSAVFISDQKILSLKNKIVKKAEPTYAAWLQTKKIATRLSRYHLNQLKNGPSQDSMMIPVYNKS
jgi:ABC-type uncharacterized transport system auxiliary subunit